VDGMSEVDGTSKWMGGGWDWTRGSGEVRHKKFTTARNVSCGNRGDR
jgi:hypothetical protein